MVRIVVLGGGRSGTLVANRLCERAERLASAEVIVTLVDRDDARIHRDRLFVVPFGVCRGAEAVTSRAAGLHADVNVVWSGVERVIPDENVIVLSPGTRVPYDVLVIATGSRARPDLTPGLTGYGWRKSMFELGTLDGATALREAIGRFTQGRLVVDAAELPVRRPLDLLRFTLLAESYFERRGLRGQVEIAFAAPLAGAFETRHASVIFTRMLAEHRITIEPDFRTAEVNGERGTLRAANGRELHFDVLAMLPVRAGAAFVERSAGLGDGRGFVRCDGATRQSVRATNIFAAGEGRVVGGAVAGATASVEARVVAENVWRTLDGRALIRGLEELGGPTPVAERTVKRLQTRADTKSDRPDAPAPTPERAANVEAPDVARARRGPARTFPPAPRELERHGSMTG